MKYQVNWTLDTGAKQFQKGDTIELKDKDAEELLKSGVISAPEPESEDSKAGK